MFGLTSIILRALVQRMYDPSHPEVRRTPLSVLYSLLASFLLIAGCSSSHSLDDETKLMLLVDFQRQFTEEHDGRDPQSADELQQWVRQLDPQDLSARQISDVDSLFVSSRDGKPFVVVPRSGAATTSDQNRIVAFEQTGVNGLRWVAFDLGQVEEMDSELIAHLQEKHVPD